VKGKSPLNKVADGGSGVDFDGGAPNAGITAMTAITMNTASLNIQVSSLSSEGKRLHLITQGLISVDW
jgi:hypothetical protein